MGRQVAVIGGGAAGMTAAIHAAGGGASVTIYEKNDRVGKKILATGNGRCNFSNEAMGAEFYHGSAREPWAHDFFAEAGRRLWTTFFPGLMWPRQKNFFLLSA